MLQNKSDSEQEESYYEEISQNTESKGPSKSFVWDYFRREHKKLTCKVKLDDGEECGVSYFDGSTTSNLINHLARKHRIFKDGSCYPSRIIKNQFIRTEKEYELIQQNLISFIIDNLQLFNIVEYDSNNYQQWVEYKKGHPIVELNRISCTAHVLQLSVRKGLNVIRHLVLRVKRLIDFFNNSLKQAEYLLTAQKDLKFKKHLSTIGDISTWWNSSYYAWERLLQLKRAILYLPSRFQSDESMSVRKDGERLACIMLTDNEWILWMTISALVKTLKSSLQQSYIESVSTDISELTILDSMEEIINDAKDLVEIKKTSLSNFEDEDPEASRFQKKQKSILSDLYANDNNKINEINEYFSLEEEGGQKDPFQWWNIKKTDFLYYQKLHGSIMYISNLSLIRTVILKRWNNIRFVRYNISS
ncbi:3585_t:CDS:2 [Gigaspora margarita]|uniref:3585_t:CDS:1 n=1 Tax=Gigaspora margarita TaxID=4874 RepID=A0ABN7ULI6_GIGMA|nr:3585_t:CDS:2 [Gigaspora margarita]